MNTTPMTIGQIFAAIGRHKFKCIFIWLLLTAAVVLMFLLWPRKYASEGRLYIQLGRNNTTLTPTSGKSSVSIQDTRETEIRSVVEIIRSRAVLEATVREVGAKKILRNSLTDILPEINLPNLTSPVVDGGMSLDEYNELKDLEEATLELERNMTVNSEKKTSVISVYVKANSAKLAQQIVGKIFEHTKRIHLKVHAVEGSAVFFDDQFDEQEGELVEAVKKLTDFRVKHNALTIGNEIETCQMIMSLLETEIIDAEVELDSADKRLGKLSEMMGKTSPMISIPKSGVERLSYEDSRTEVFKLESELERLAASYSRHHPERVKVEAQLRKLKSSLGNMKRDRTESSLVSNPVFEDMQVDFMRAKADYSAALAQLNSLRLKQNKTLAQAKKLNMVEMEADQLRRDVAIARQYLAIYTQKRGEAKGMSLLDDRDISDVVVAQAPNYVVKHVSPKGSIVLPFGLLFSFVGSLAAALFFDRNHLSGSLNEGEVEQVLNLPVLVTLPRVYSSRNMVN